MKLKTYKVSWLIETIADSHIDAAREALDCIINGTARVFLVQEIEGKIKHRPIQIDLDEESDKK